MKENKTIIISSVLICSLLAVFILIDYKNETKSLTTSQNSKSKKTIYKEVKEQKPVGRKIASVPTSDRIIQPKKALVNIQRKVVGSNPLAEYTVVNVVNKDWKKMAMKKLSFTWGNKATNSIQIEEVKPLIYVKHGIGKNVEHVKVSLTDKAGLKSVYEAYVDSSNGSIIQTWNKTRYEFNKKFYFNAEGKEFHSTPLNYEAN